MLKNLHSTTINSISNLKYLTIGFSPHIPKSKNSTFIRAKLAPDDPRYLELELFKQQLQGNGNEFSLCTYTISQEKVRWYRSVFFGIGLIFLVLALLTFRQNILIFTIFFGNVGFLAKAFFGGLSLVLALSAATLGHSLCVAKEAGHHSTSKAKHQLMRLYGRKRLEQGLQGLFFLGENYHKYSVLKREYHHVIGLMEEQREKTTHLLQKIQKYDTVDAGYRELLFNQALAEFSDCLKEHLRNFKES